MLRVTFLNTFALWVAAGCVSIRAQNAAISCSNPADGDEFLFFSNELNFSNAVIFCANFSSDTTLARVGDSGTAAAIFADKDFSADFWVGIFDKFLVGGNGNTTRFTFVDETTEELPFIQGTAGQAPWNTGQPDDGGKEVEGCVKFRASDGFFEDKRCAETHAFACRRICPSEVIIINPTLSPTPTPQNNIGLLFEGDNIVGQALFGAGFLFIFAVIVYALVLLNRERGQVAEIKLLLEDDMIEPIQKKEAPREHEDKHELVINIDTDVAGDPLRFSVQSRPERLASIDI